jgi:hypothetical protein
MCVQLVLGAMLSILVALAERIRHLIVVEVSTVQFRGVIL